MGRTAIHQDARGLNDDDDDDDDDDNDNKNNKEVEEGTKHDDSKKSRWSDGKREESLGAVSPDPRQMISEWVTSLMKEKENLTSTVKRQLVHLLQKYADKLTTKPGTCRVLNIISELIFRLTLLFSFK